MIKQLAQRLFQWYCHPDYYPEIQGDLEEMYQRNLPQGRRKAQWQYTLQVLGLCRPSLMRSFSNITFLQPTMFKNYILVSYRNILHQKFFTAINIAGLAIGLATFLLIHEYIQFEKSYDTFFTDADQIYRLSLMQTVNGEVVTKEATNYAPAAKAVKEEIPEVIESAVTTSFNDLIFKKGESLVKETKVATGDEKFLRIFDYQILQGAPDKMLSEPNSLVLTKSKAEFYFGNENPLGETLMVLGSFNRAFKVTGVIEDVPENTQYQFDMLLSNSTIRDQIDKHKWRISNYFVFLKLDNKADVSALESKLKTFSEKYLSPESHEAFTLISVQNIHLQSDFQYEATIPGSGKAVNFMRIISFFILIVAWINYINLSTARAVNRAKEVGLRKVIGAQKSQLVNQFLMEAMLVNFLAALLALLIAEFSLPFYNQLVGRVVMDHVWNTPSFLKMLLLFFAIGTLVSGIYPALVLAGFKPLTVLKGKFRNSKSGNSLRKGLVVMQFATSIVLIAGTFVVYRQLDFMMDKDLGIDTDYVLGLSVSGVDDSKWEAYESKVVAFTETLQKESSILKVGSISNLPGSDDGDISYTTSEVRMVGQTGLIPGSTYWQRIDDNLLNALDMKLLYGRNFDRHRTADSMVVMVNQAFLKKFNLTDNQEAIGKKIQFGDKPEDDQYEMIGVIQDFNRTSLRSDVEPTVYFPSNAPGNIVMKLDPNTFRDAIDQLETTWKNFFPDAPLEYTFLDDRFETLYQQDQRFGKIFSVFSCMAIFIATLGLFGLSSFMALQRKMEVGVRKVLGASVPSIIGIFFQEFLLLLCIAGLISIPIIYFGMNFWLENYAYRIDFPWLLCGLALIIVIFFALFTVGYQTYKVAVINPAKTLKNE